MDAAGREEARKRGHSCSLLQDDALAFLLLLPPARRAPRRRLVLLSDLAHELEETRLVVDLEARRRLEESAAPGASGKEAEAERRGGHWRENERGVQECERQSRCNTCEG